MEKTILDEIRNLKSSLLDISQDRWLNIKEICKYSGLSESTIHRAIHKGELKVSKKTGKNLFRISWVDRWLNDG